MKYKFFLIFLVFFMCQTSSIQAQSFQLLDISARPVAMGNAVAASVNDLDAVIYNPAGLAAMEANKLQLNLSYQNLFTSLERDNLSQVYLALGRPLPFGVMAASARQFKADLLTESAFSISYANHFPEGLAEGKIRSISFGVSLKIFHRSFTQNEFTRIDPVFAQGLSKTTTSFDLGIQRNPSNGILWGASILNASSPNLGLKEKDEISRQYLLGFGYRFTPKSPLTLLTQFSSTGDIDTVHFGAEKWLLKKTLAFRSGWEMGSEHLRNLDLGAGFGMDFGDLRLDINYAYTAQLSGLRKDSSGNQTISTRIAF